MLSDNNINIGDKTVEESTGGIISAAANNRAVKHNN